MEIQKQVLIVVYREVYIIVVKSVIDTLLTFGNSLLNGFGEEHKCLVSEARSSQVH